MSDDVRISVRNLVEFILKSGDIDTRRGRMAEKEAMQLGSRIHKKIQKQMGAMYHPEVPLRTTIPIREGEDGILLIEGRADGIFEQDDKVMIDEIKGTFMDLSHMKEPVPVHKAQAMCYACIYAQDHDLKEIDIQLTYCNMETEEIKRFRETLLFGELSEWFAKLTQEYLKWVRFSQHWKAVRQKSIKDVQFPFPYREGQKELVTHVYHSIFHKKKLFIQAPTGVGKTISTVFPAVKAMGEGLGGKIFYLTAKTITRTVAKEAFDILKQQGLQYKVLIITAKEKLCTCEKVECNPVSCPYAKGHNDRINDAVFSMLNQHDSFTREVLLTGAEEYQVCPFELCLDISLWVDAIICDYNYVFDPNVSLKRFFGDNIKGDYFFLIDEAHNLVERGREMYSAVLYKEDFLDIKKLLSFYGKKLTGRLEKCNKYLLGLKRESEGYSIHNDIGTFIIHLMNVQNGLESLFENDEYNEVPDRVLEFYFEVLNFLAIYEKLDDHYVIYSELEPGGRFKLKLFCVDTSKNIQECLNKGNSTVFFSATLLPVQYYQKLFSEEKDDYTVYAKSPFSQERRKLLIASDVSSRYTRRNRTEYERLASYIVKSVRCRKGNYLAFFPSYKFLQDVLECFDELKDADMDCIVQTSYMNEEQREIFLENFVPDLKHSLVGFCVMGGIFGEGIDLKEEALIGALIVGTGLPQVCNEREILKSYYDRREMDGFAYAYLYPGMNKVLQSAGRVIRTTEDKGIILLLDERFHNFQYRNNFPLEWSSYESCNLENVESKLRKFWD